MTISERMLRKWRKNALVEKEKVLIYGDGGSIDKGVVAICETILQLTQELLDNHLMKKKGEGK